jgi:hypothetical protein
MRGAVRSAVRLRSSASSSTINTARRFCCACPTAGFPLLAFVVIGIQSAHERRQPSRERGRNDVGECCPQFARKNQGEIHSVEWYQGRTAHLAACSSNRNLPSLTHPYVDNATEPVLFWDDGREFAYDASQFLVAGTMTLAE